MGAADLGRMPGALAVGGFGNGDCAARCGGHLLRFDRQPTIDAVKPTLGVSEDALTLVPLHF